MSHDPRRAGPAPPSMPVPPPPPPPAVSACQHEVTEHAVMMSGGGYHVRNGAPYIEEIFPLAEWIVSERRFGGKVYRRRIIVVEDWTEVTS